MGGGVAIGSLRRSRWRHAGRLAVCLTFLPACAGATRAERVPQNLILLSIDTLRADRLGAYGYERDTSPALDALAARGIRVETVIAESTWTLPSHVTMLSGFPPALHGATHPKSKPSPELPLLAEVLRENGFDTFAWTGGVFVSKRYGLDRGFQEWDDRGLRLEPMLAAAEARIAQVPKQQRFFAFLHTYAVHCPYDPPEGYAERFATRPAADFIETDGRCGNPQFNAMKLTEGQGKYLSDRYDAGIRAADDQLGRFFAALEKRGVLANTLVVILSDHGDEFLEHGRIGHRGSMYIQSLRIPWIMLGPGLPPAVVQQPAALADVLPTLLELLQVPAPPNRGRSLVPVIRGVQAVEGERVLYSESEWGPPVYSAIIGPNHIVVDGMRMSVRVFDRSADPAEQHDRFDRDDPITQRLWRATEERRKNQSADPARSAAQAIEGVTQEQQEQLEALGYVEP